MLDPLLVVRDGVGSTEVAMRDARHRVAGRAPVGVPA